MTKRPHISRNDEDKLWSDSFSDNKPNQKINDGIGINDSISTLEIIKPVKVKTGTSISDLLKRMRSNNANCVLIMDGQSMRGIITERDLLLKVIGKGLDLSVSLVDTFMTKEPETLTMDDPIAHVLNKMHVGGFRNVPIVNDNGQPISIISVNDIISVISEHFSSEIINLPPLDKRVDTISQEGG